MRQYSLALSLVVLATTLAASPALACSKERSPETDIKKVSNLQTVMPEQIQTASSATQMVETRTSEQTMMMATEANKPAMSASEDLVDIATDNGSFKTLVKAIDAAGLSETLRSGRDFTVFAPTDAAFAALPEGTLDNLLKPENKIELIKLLSYHIVPGRVMAQDVVKLNKAATAEGQTVSIMVKDDAVKINDADVIKTDISAKNGVIHVIDSVLMPQ
ncbi:MAG: fasciclin domain-containing protein [Vampirovibrionales bacterium]|nr:fasciclin domain-containing protein [Vampirovibrionales bacterium]